MPHRASLLAVPAGSGTFMYYYYSGGPNRVHNVQGLPPVLCPGKLDLSNTRLSRKTLSFLKPPHEKSSFAAFLRLLDGIEAPGKGKRGTLQGSVIHCSVRFRTVPSKGPVHRP